MSENSTVKNKSQTNFLKVDFSDMSAGAGSPLDPPVTEALFSTPFSFFFLFFSWCGDQHILAQFLFKHFQTKGKQKWQPYFYKAGRHILQSPPPKKMFGREHFSCRRERPPPRTQRCVYHVSGVNDCLRRIGGLNSPASPPLRGGKNPDTSYTSHTLQEEKRLRPPK